jgi:glycosyltransferase involved in cell wall biosynthesis
MRVLFVIDNLGGGGAQKLIYDLVKNIEGEDCEMLLLSNKSDKYCTLLKDEGVPVHIIPETCKSVVSKLNYMWKVIKDGRYSVIHANLFPAIYYAAIIKRIHGKKCPPVLMTEHSTDNNRRHKGYLKPIEKYIYGSFDHIISISKETQDALLKYLGKSADSRFSVIENGIDIEKYQKAQAYDKKLIFPEYKDGDYLIGMVASFTPQKNHKTMIDAMALLPDEYKLILVGEGPLFENIKGQVREKNLESRIVFLGFRKDVAEIMKTVDIVCVPSIWEGFGLVAVEAMAAGTPVIVSNVPGLANVVGNYGSMIDPYRADTIQSAVEKRLIYKYNDEMISEAKIRASEFDILQMAKKYVEIFKSS